MSSTDSTTELTRLVAQLQPMLDVAADLRPSEASDPAAVAALERSLAEQFPVDGPAVTELGQTLRRGVDEGWLCDRGDAQARFSRVAKPSPTTRDFSIDVVSMLGDALEHTHPSGEITLGFAADPADHTTCRFDSRPAGWVFLGPGSRHVPRVEGARMHLIYFLPHGDVQWHPAR